MMSYSIKIIRKDDPKTTEWSGGSTTQLAIYPENAEYERRNFRWRISKATMKAENSLFTNLPGYWRLLMATDGEFTLEHLGMHRAALQPFEQDSFSGDWTTNCFGKGDDLNVMLAPGCKGELKAVMIVDYVDEILGYNNDNRDTETYECVYVNDGDVKLSIDGQVLTHLNQGDLLIYKNQKVEHQVKFSYINLNRHISKEVNVIRITIHQEINEE
ncbi:HutD/Ves family protein [Paenibacillus agri]|uniref:HutD family protein n=1 Tax=Paenibacillus agri TaxID=2744309 RepID=A0A850ENF9_9BACL|nr:HutD family protein [Paenibacillus agri]NUU60122.1 HutD family protein [Paenibacillus agri]